MQELGNITFHYQLLISILNINTKYIIRTHATDSNIKFRVVNIALSTSIFTKLECF